MPGALATYLPGRRVTGIRVNPDSIELEVRYALGRLRGSSGAPRCRPPSETQAAGRRIDVTIVDIELPESETR